MREIKFRAWKDKKYYYNEDINYISFRDDEIQFVDQDNDTCTILSVLVLEQYTGLKDKNGVIDLYDNDIVLLNGKKYKISFYLGGWHLIDIWEDSEDLYLYNYRVDKLIKKPSTYELWSELEVIGNIHDEVTK